MLLKSTMPLVLAAAVLGTAPIAHGQDFPDGPGKETVTAVCGGCHDINRLRAGYTPEGGIRWCS